MRSVEYGRDVLSGSRRKKVPEVPAEPGLVVEDAASGFCGAVLRVEKGNVVLEDRHGKQRLFPMRPAAFLFEGKPATLVEVREAAPASPARSASGSVKVEGLRARTARGSRIWVEGVHDAELVERIWGHDLRVEGVVVEPLHGVDELPGLLAEFGPGPGRRVGVLVDHLVAGSKESRLVEGITDEHVMITGHPYVDIWQAVKPAALGIREWPQVPRGEDWKRGVCSRLGWGEPAAGWRRVLSAVSEFRDVETPLLGAVERLIDFVTADG
ncbi:DUF3097 domain-containing protein [Saccharopolyspora rhizosphaerae]|uniref:DUF3097 domain-containing protein n=1 Tax=Saccharopolyspora rhizosphaerae TaxID=2492662 RepID=A0A3R8P6C3_9PSEU|nr:DUF3097 domain-containing protein [Saccharopolyspora rhizosphaerae]RRO20490.1 DUF3097 domain-containing protein [Saccharopolyspora rhizosphaerae]